MPIYGYRCHSCQREFEVQQRMSDPPQAACPDCGAAGTRLFYPAGILFKGSGFYKTDSRSAPATSTPASSAPAADPASPGSDGSGDSTKPVAPAKDQPTTPPAPAPAKTTKPAAPAAD